MAVSYTQDWARVLYVGDVQVLLCRRSLPFDHDDVPEELKRSGKVVFFIDIEYHLNDDEYNFTAWSDSKGDRDNMFNNITSEDLQKLIEVELGYDLPG
jgi:hypothetical protein